MDKDLTKILEEGSKIAKKQNKPGIYLLLLIALVVVSYYSISDTSTTDTSMNGKPVQVVTTEYSNSENKVFAVSKIVDGDTVHVMDESGTDYTIRVIGMNSPETGLGNRQVECFGKEASEYAKQLLSNTNVFISSDETQQERDKYNRLLRYIELPDGRDFAETMIREGYAYEYTYDVPYKRQRIYKDAESVARQGMAGLWSSNACSGRK